MIVTAIVLAGGRSSRFGTDKLEADLGGRSLLAATIAAVAGVAGLVIVAGRELPEASEAVGPVELVLDAEALGGPLAALANVLGSASFERGSVAIVVGGDMPRLVPSVLRLMVGRLAGDESADAVVLEAPDAANGDRRRQVLPLALRVATAKPAAAALVAAGERSLRALVDQLDAVELPRAAWLPLDPARLTLLDVDTPSDLARVREAGQRGSRPDDLR